MNVCWESRGGGNNEVNLEIVEVFRIYTLTFDIFDVIERGNPLVGIRGNINGQLAQIMYLPQKTSFAGITFAVNNSHDTSVLSS